LAGTYGIDPGVAQTLSLDEDDRVLDALAANYSTPPDVLRTVALRTAALRDVVAHNPFAPAEFKRDLALSEHASLAISQFLEDSEATAGQRVQLMQRYDAAIREEDPLTTLGSAWDEIREV